MEVNTLNPTHQIEKIASQEGISINALCEEAGIARSTWTRWKNKSNGSNTSTLIKVEAALTRLVKKRKHNPAIRRNRSSVNEVSP